MDDHQDQAQNKIQLAWETGHIQISPGKSGKVEFFITNLGAEADYFEILVKGVPATWVTLDTPVIHLGAGGRGVVQLMINVQTPQSRLGRYPLDIQATSQGDPSKSEILTGELTVAAYQTEGRIGLLLASTNYAIPPGGTGSIHLLLEKSRPRPGYIPAGCGGNPHFMGFNQQRSDPPGDGRTKRDRDRASTSTFSDDIGWTNTIYHNDPKSGRCRTRSFC